MMNPMTGEEIKAVEDTWKRLLRDVEHAESSPHGDVDLHEAWRDAMTWVLAYIFGEGDIERYRTEPVLHAQIHLTVQMIMQLHEPGQTLRNLDRDRALRKQALFAQHYSAGPSLRDLLQRDRHTP